MLVRTVAAIALAYTLIQLVAVSVAPDIGKSDTPLVEIARRLMGPWGALALGLGVVFSIGGGSLTSLLTAPRLTFAMSRNGSLPAWFGKIGARSGVPVNSILFCGFLSIVMAVNHGFIWLTILSTFVRLLTYLLCIASLPFIERALPSQEGQFMLPGGLTIPALGFVLTVWLIAHSDLDNFWISGLMVAVGTLIFWFCSHRRLMVGVSRGEIAEETTARLP
jgi:amino acid transporter